MRVDTAAAKNLAPEGVLIRDPEIVDASRSRFGAA
jgi:hypothetical protein